MGINGMGGSPYMQGLHTNSMQRTPSAGGVNARQMADNDMARRMLPIAAAETAGRAATEAKGMFVDTYA